MVCRKVEHIAEETASIVVTLNKYSTREQRRMQEHSDREELLRAAELGRRFKSDMDETQHLMSATARSRGYLNEIYESGTNILSTMAGNRERLKVSLYMAFCEGFDFPR